MSAGCWLLAVGFHGYHSTFGLLNLARCVWGAIGAMVGPKPARIPHRPLGGLYYQQLPGWLSQVAGVGNPQGGRL